MKNLIIVGNGFDLAHDLKTGYPDFIDDLKKNPEYYNIQKNDQNVLLNSLLKNDKQLWSDIESTYFDILNNLNNLRFLQTTYGFLINSYYSSKDLNNDFDIIKGYLAIYLEKRQKDFIPIKNYQNLFKEFNNQDTIVLNFNYTNTVNSYLKKLNIEEINIHGELNNENNPIIFGFAADQEESKQLLIEKDNNYVRNIKKFNYLFTDNETKLKQHLTSPKYNIFILGHSCGISDKLILSQIFNSKNIHKIIPFYYKDRNGYFDTMVNIDRIIDDYSKSDGDSKSFNKLLPFPQSHKMPQKEDVNIRKFLTPLFESVKGSQYK